MAKQAQQTPTTPMVHDEDTSTGKVQDPLYYLYDGMGRVTELTKPSAQVSDKYRFDPYGVELPGGKMSPNAYKNLNNPFGYNGEQYDTEAGLSYMRNRYYEPDTGRFMNRDLLPGYLMEPLSMNAYAYVGNDPQQYVDPLGLSKIRRYSIVPEGADNSFVLSSSLPRTGQPNSKQRLYNPDGSVKQEREYGPDGKALKDIDYNHGGVGHEFPHQHEWKDGDRQNPGVPLPKPDQAPNTENDSDIVSDAGWVVVGYWIISEATRIFPPRNLIPVP